jgi:hypothetical protein
MQGLGFVYDCDPLLFAIKGTRPVALVIDVADDGLNTGQYMIYY